MVQIEIDVEGNLSGQIYESNFGDTIFDKYIEVDKLPENFKENIKFYNIKNKKLVLNKELSNNDELEKLKKEKLAELDLINEETKDNGFVVKVKDLEVIFRCRLKDLIYFNSLMLFEKQYIDFKFKDKPLREDVFVKLDDSQLVEISSFIDEFLQENMKLKSELKTLINELNLEDIKVFSTEDKYKKLFKNKKLIL